MSLYHVRRGRGDSASRPWLVFKVEAAEQGRCACWTWHFGVDRGCKLHGVRAYSSQSDAVQSYEHRRTKVPGTSQLQLQWHRHWHWHWHSALFEIRYTSCRRPDRCSCNTRAATVQTFTTAFRQDSDSRLQTPDAPTLLCSTLRRRTAKHTLVASTLHSTSTSFSFWRFFSVAPLGL